MTTKIKSWKKIAPHSDKPIKLAPNEKRRIIDERVMLGRRAREEAIERMKKGNPSMVKTRVITRKDREKSIGDWVNGKR